MKSICNTHLMLIFKFFPRMRQTRPSGNTVVEDMVEVEMVVMEVEMMVKEVGMMVKEVAEEKRVEVSNALWVKLC